MAVISSGEWVCQRVAPRSSMATSANWKTMPSQVRSPPGMTTMSHPAARRAAAVAR